VVAVSCHRFLRLTVELNDRSVFGGDTRPVGYQGDTRPGRADLDDLVHEVLDRVFMMASQAVNLDMGGFPRCLKMIQGAGSAWTFYFVEVNHGGFDAGMSQEGSCRADIGAGLESMGGERMAHRVRSEDLGRMNESRTKVRGPGGAQKTSLRRVGRKEVGSESASELMVSQARAFSRRRSTSRQR
jgi:hypothetical protein